MHLHLPALLGIGGAENILTVATIFAFVIIVVAIRTYARLQRQKMWHETARNALDKGQPLPPNFNNRSWRLQGVWPLYRGLILIGAGVGLLFIGRHDVQEWAPLPICIGVAYLVVGFINLARFKASDGSQNPADRM